MDQMWWKSVNNRTVSSNIVFCMQEVLIDVPLIINSFQSEIDTDYVEYKI